MSLINDALRKARQEAAEREAEEKGVSYRPPKAHLPERSSLGLGVVLGLVFGFLGAFAGAYLLLRPSAPDTTTTATALIQATQAQVPTVQTETSEIEPAQVEPAQVEPAPLSPPAEEIPATTPARGVGSAAEERVAQEEVRGAAATPSPAGSTPSTDAPPARAAASTAIPAVSGTVENSRVDDQPARAASAAPPRLVEPAATAGLTIDSMPESESTSATDEASALPRIQPPEQVGQIDDTNEFVLEADLGDLRLTLDFIVWIPGRPFAQINGRQLEVGQVIEGLLVEKIERERVTLRGSNGLLVLRVR